MKWTDRGGSRDRTGLDGQSCGRRRRTCRPVAPLRATLSRRVACAVAFPETQRGRACRCFAAHCRARWGKFRLSVTQRLSVVPMLGSGAGEKAGRLHQMPPVGLATPLRLRAGGSCRVPRAGHGGSERRGHQPFTAGSAGAECRIWC